jgi:hypothetical protein
MDCQTVLFEVLMACMLRVFMIAGGLWISLGAAGLFAQVPTRLESSTELALGARTDRLPATGLIAFDKMGFDPYFDLYTMLPNASGQICLTCGKPVPQLHSGNPVWHPSGSYIVFQIQDPALPILPPEFEPFATLVTNPGFGVNNNLWATTADGSQFWQLTSVEAGMGVLHARFNRAGTRLLWSEKIGLTGKDGQWTMKVADFRLANGVHPQLRNIAQIQPLGTDIFYETHEFNPDGSGILFSAGWPSQDSLDIYTYDPASGVLRNLTNSPEDWDEHAHFTPDGSKIMWASSRDINKPRAYVVPYLDYWMMNLDGSSRSRMTYFNEPSAPEYFPNGLVTADFSFGPTIQWIYSSLQKSDAQGLPSVWVVSLLKFKSR